MKTARLCEFQTLAGGVAGFCEAVTVVIGGADKN